MDLSWRATGTVDYVVKPDATALNGRMAQPGHGLYTADRPAFS